MNAFVTFMSSPAGRAARVIAGLVLMLVGVAGGGAAWILAVIGVVPLAAGALDVCLLGPLFGLPLSGKAVRSR